MNMSPVLTLHGGQFDGVFLWVEAFAARRVDAFIQGNEGSGSDRSQKLLQRVLILLCDGANRDITTCILCCVLLIVLREG